MLYFLLFYIFKYRRKVVAHNLKIAFPFSNDSFLKDISKKFYKNLCDIIVETIKAYSIPPEELIKRVKILNKDLLDNNYQKQQPIIVMTSHLGNWEWLLLANCLLLDYEVDAVYKRLKSKYFDKLMLQIRGRFGAKPVEKDALLRSIVKGRNETRIIAMVSDQSPAASKVNVWKTFFNLEVPFYTGAEKIASMTSYPVFFASMQRKQRGYYEVTFQTISNGAESNGYQYITDKYIEMMEDAIRQNPSDWLWSHKRWKHFRNIAG